MLRCVRLATASEPTGMLAKGVTPMPEKISQEQIVEVTTQDTKDYGAQLPEHVILRFARFLLPKIQEDLDKKDE